MTYVDRLRELRIRREIATVYIQSGFPSSLAGWKAEWKDEILELEQMLWESGRYMKSAVDNYKVVRIP